MKGEKYLTDLLNYQYTQGEEVDEFLQVAA